MPIHAETRGVDEKPGFRKTRAYLFPSGRLYGCAEPFAQNLRARKAAVGYMHIFHTAADQPMHDRARATAGAQYQGLL